MCIRDSPYTAIVEGGKQYISEEEYKKLSDEDAERYWTIQKNAYIVRGQLEVADQWVFDTFSFQHGVILKEAIEDLAKLRQHDEDFVTITEYADNTLRGTDRTKHWRVGGCLLYTSWKRLSVSMTKTASGTSGISWGREALQKVWCILSSLHWRLWLTIR